MIQKNIKIQIPTGLEARPVAVLVQIASKYESSIFIESGTKKVNAKSIMGMMALGLEADEEITVIASEYATMLPAPEPRPGPTAMPFCLA